jgi:hypothetical protein
MSVGLHYFSNDFLSNQGSASSLTTISHKSL